jgi:hypothetical protein
MQLHPKQYQHTPQNKVKSRESIVEGGDVGVERGDGAASTLREAAPREAATVWRQH